MSSVKKHKILLVEDDPMLRESLIDIFELKGYEVIFAKDGREGVNIMKKQRPDLVVSDVMMPEMDGFQLLKEIKSDPKTELLPIILLTAKVGLESKLYGLELGADDYITKPFEFKELFIKIKNLLKKQEKFIQLIGINLNDEAICSQDILFIKKLWILLEENIENPNLLVGFIADRLNMSPSTLQRNVKRIIGKPTVQVIKEYKLRKANELIKTNYGTISEIAFKTGFNSLPYFSSSYKDFFGKNPTEDLPK